MASFNYFYHVLIIYVAISFSKVKSNVNNNILYIHFHTILNTTYSREAFQVESLYTILL